MADNETIADIAAEKRRIAKEIRDHARRANETAEDLEEEADRLEAAHRRERGDAAKLREALESIASNLERRLFARYPSSASDEWMYQKANTALAEPVKNYEVGTAEEQRKEEVDDTNG